MTPSINKKIRTLASLAKLLLASPNSFATLIKVKRGKLTLLGLGALADLALAIHAIERKNVPGMLVEAGSALGGSAILMASCKRKQRLFAIYDTFEMIPSPGEKDGADAKQRYEVIKAGKAKGLAGDAYYGYMEDLYHRVQTSFSQAGFPVDGNCITMHKGLIENTMQIDQPVAAAHIDCDWYSPVMVCLEQIVPRLSPGGVLIIDDYYQWSGARRAVDEYFARNSGEYVFQNKSRLHIQRQKFG